MPDASTDLQIEYRWLTPDDWEDYRSIRLRAVKDHPDAFGGEYEKESQLAEADFRGRLERYNLVAAYHGDKIVGTMAYVQSDSPKFRHWVRIQNVYLKPEFRGRGIIDLMLEQLIGRITQQPEIVQIRLGLFHTNIAARKVYERHGFQVYGEAPREALVDQQYLNEILMYRDV
jgi:RimJ/RimL family protein N-acetyltransferase